MTRGIGQHHGDLRQALVAAALALVEEVGVEAVTLRAVARRAGVSPGAPYHHFPDKVALLAEVAREGFAALAEQQERHREVDPGDRLEAMAADYVRFARHHPTHYAVMFLAVPDDVAGEGADALRTTARATFGNLVAAHLAANPGLDEPEAVRRSLLAWALAHGAVQVGHWMTSLDPAASVERLAVDVGRAVRAAASA